MKKMIVSERMGAGKINASLKNDLNDTLEEAMLNVRGMPDMDDIVATVEDLKDTADTLWMNIQKVVEAVFDWNEGDLVYKGVAVADLSPDDQEIYWKYDGRSENVIVDSNTGSLSDQAKKLLAILTGGIATRNGVEVSVWE